MNTKGFEGWYFKHQNKDKMIAFIPGTAESGAFVQVISPFGSEKFSLPGLDKTGGVIRAGECIFSRRGCKIELPGISGRVLYGKLTPLRSDIMGPFRFLPMECRHGVVSMAHSLKGGFSVGGEYIDLSGGAGYIEKDSGSSFPGGYMWVQCNSFSKPCSVMAAVARIPFCKKSFNGCICAVVYGGREYRFATYNGARIIKAKAKGVCLSQGKLLLDIAITPAGKGHPLASPVSGKMSGTIHESANARVRVRLWEDKKPVFDLQSGYAAYEFVPSA